MNFSGQFDRVTSRLIARHGGTGTLKVKSEGVYSDGELSTVTITSYPVNISLFDYPQSSAGDKSNFGTLILEGDKQCYMQPVSKANELEEEPRIKANRDLIIIGSTEWKILALKEINPSGADVIVYELHLRK